MILLPEELRAIRARAQKVADGLEPANPQSARDVIRLLAHIGEQEHRYSRACQMVGEQLVIEHGGFCNAVQHVFSSIVEGKKDV